MRGPGGRPPARLLERGNYLQEHTARLPETRGYRPQAFRLLLEALSVRRNPGVAVRDLGNPKAISFGERVVAKIARTKEAIHVKWVTRKNANVDRIACPWLIRRFIDPEAALLFVPAEEVLAVAEREQAIPYDVGGVELGHVDGRCSFESILVKHGITDPALRLLGRIVHGADIPADISVEPEAAGLRAAAYGFATIHGDNDMEKLRLETPMYDALYAWCRHRVAQERSGA